MRIGVLGCGWLGLPLAKKLVSKQHTVKGSTTSLQKLPDLEEHGIKSYYIELFEDVIQGTITQFLDELDILIVDIPPGLRKDPNSSFIAKIEQLCSCIVLSSIEQIVFTSSISVYAEGYPFPTHTEDSTLYSSTRSAEQLLAAEKLIKGLPQTSLILRLGGLIGEDRHPVHNLAGKTLKNGSAPINLVHRNDVISLILNSLKWIESIPTLNVVYPDHTPKKIYYQDKAEMIGLKPPTFEHSGKPTGKIIHSKAEELIPNFFYQQKV
ncbi:epimerase [Gangjinia marincola]|uniref:Epimerase n=1 Tax=Gangjinia marincola TaxID=578463 RepID=A0ABN1MEN5_9FLAO